MLTVELRDAEKAKDGLSEVEIFCDSEGLAVLQRQLDFLKKGSTHVHLKTTAWAGNELSETVNGADNVLINHLRISVVPEK